MSLTPTAIYTSPDIEAHKITPGDGPHTTNGITTQISDVVLNAGGEDRDKPTEASGTPLGQLRAELTSLQDNVNKFLTQRMKGEDNQEIERRVLDEGVDESDSD